MLITVSPFNTNPSPFPFKAKELAAHVPVLRYNKPIALITNTGHEIHHARDKGNVEAPVRIASILKEINKTGLFRPLPARKISEKYVTAIVCKIFFTNITMC